MFPVLICPVYRYPEMTRDDVPDGHFRTRAKERRNGDPERG